jgi:membrane protease YdiL (CAAX protease family)
MLLGDDGSCAFVLRSSAGRKDIFRVDRLRFTPQSSDTSTWMSIEAPSRSARCVVVLTGGVLGAGLVWGWLRQRTRSVWPALLSHTGAVIAYLAVHLWLTRGKP